MSMLDPIKDCGCVVSAFGLYVHVSPKCTKGHSQEEAEREFLGFVVSEKPQEMQRRQIEACRAWATR